MIWSMILLSIPLVTIVYYLSYFTLSILLRVHNKHYFLGFWGSFFEFRIRNVIFTVGTFIPFFGLARFSKVENFARHRPDYPWQFSGRPRLARVLATYGGVIGVLVFSVVILTAISIIVEEQYVSRDEINKYGVHPSSLAESYGFQRGDKVLTINGRAFERYQELLDAAVYQRAGNTFLVERAGAERIIHVPEGDHDLPPGDRFLEILVPFEIDSVLEHSPAEQIALLKGDRIIAVNGTKVDMLNDMRHAFSADADGTVDLQIQRLKSSDTLVLVRQVALDDQRNLGILALEQIHYTVKANGFSDAVQKGITNTFQLLKGQFYTIFGIFLSEKKVHGGPISVSAAFGDERYWEFFCYLTANFASICVVWNIFPYPRSAFWEVVPLAYEGMTGKKYPYAVFRGSLQLAWFIFWGMVLFTLLLDIMKLF